MSGQGYPNTAANVQHFHPRLDPNLVGKVELMPRNGGVKGLTLVARWKQACKKSHTRKQTNKQARKKMNIDKGKREIFGNGCTHTQKSCAHC